MGYSSRIDFGSVDTVQRELRIAEIDGLEMGEDGGLSALRPFHESYKYSVRAPVLQKLRACTSVDWDSVEKIFSGSALVVISIHDACSVI